MTKSKTIRMFTGLAVFGALAFGSMACEVEEDDDPAVEEPAEDPAEEPEDDPMDDGEDDGLEDDEEDDL